MQHNHNHIDRFTFRRNIWKRFPNWTNDWLHIWNNDYNILGIN